MTSEERIKELMEWLKAIVLALVVGGILSFSIRPTLVSGSSMMPALKDGNYLIIDKLSYRFDLPGRGDIIVFKTNLKTLEGASKDLIKRVVGLPGDRIDILDGKVFINDQELYESYVLDDFTDGAVSLTVPEKKVFVLGDNREISMDSRSSEIGLVDYDKIRGKIFIRVLPIKEFGQVK